MVAQSWDGLWVGGTTKRIVNKTKCPVLIVPEGSIFKKIDKIAFGTDFSLDDFEVIGNLLAFAKHFNASVTAVHVSENSNDASDRLVESHKGRNSIPPLEEGELSVQTIKDSNVSNGPKHLCFRE